jgi:hypothetical protein
MDRNAADFASDHRWITIEGGDASEALPPESLMTGQSAAQIPDADDADHPGTVDTESGLKGFDHGGDLIAAPWLSGHPQFRHISAHLSIAESQDGS